MYNRFLKAWEWIKEESDLIMAGVVLLATIAAMIAVSSLPDGSSCT